MYFDPSCSYTGALFLVLLLVTANTQTVSHGCVYEELICKNGGTFDPAQCIRLCQCPDVAHWRTAHVCDCPRGFYSSDCSLVNGTLYSCPGHTLFDGTMLNVDARTKHMECFLNYQKRGFISIHEHRISVDVKYLDTLGHSTVTLDVVSRHRNGSAPSPNLCYPVQHDMTCDLADCYGETTVVDHRQIMTYKCLSLNCTSCGAHPEQTLCSPLLNAIVQHLHPPVSAIFSNLDPKRGTADMKFFTPSLALDLECFTGACVDKPLDPNAHSSVIPLWITVALVGGGVLLLGFLTVCAFKVTHRPRERFGLLLSEEKESLIRQTTEVLPRFGIVFREIRYDVPVSRMCFWNKIQTKNILQGVSGVVSDGQILGILGSSGCGKTSLLDILAARHKSGHIAGEIDLVCHSMNANIADITSYVLQDDHLLSTQTVLEAIRFSARMKLPPNCSEDMVSEKVQQVLRQLSIEHIQHRKIGHSDEGGGLSGGERRRVALGVELVTDPRIIILDEPTSGLDSYSATVVIQAIQQVAAAGCAVLLSIHQPSSFMFEMMDQILILSPNGRVLYYGVPTKCVNYFQSKLGCTISQNQSPAEFVMDLVSTSSIDQLDRMVACFSDSDERDVQLKALLTALDRSAIGRRVMCVSENKQLEESDKPATTAELPIFKRPRPSTISRFTMLCGRHFSHVLRHPSLMLTQMLVTIGVAVSLGLVFYQVDNELAGIQNRTGVLFFIIIYFSLVSLASLGVLVEDRTMFLREKAAGTYTTLPYFGSKLIADLVPLRILAPLLFGSICYFMIGLHSGVRRFGVFLLILVLVNATATAVCFAISAYFKTVGQINLVASLFFIFSMLFGGLLLNNRNSVSKLTNLSWLSFFHYGYEALMVNEFQDLQVVFNPSGFNPTSINGGIILRNMGLAADMLVTDLWILVAASTGFFLLSFAILRSQHHRK